MLVLAVVFGGVWLVLFSPVLAVKQVEVEVTDGELNLRFVASEGEPIVAAVEVLQPAS